MVGQELEANQRLFIRQGSYLLVERARTIVYRNFFRRVYSLHPAGTTSAYARLDPSTSGPSPPCFACLLLRMHLANPEVHVSSRVPSAELDIGMFKRCLGATGVTTDVDEIECVIANLIFKG